MAQKRSRSAGPKAAAPPTPAPLSWRVTLPVVGAVAGMQLLVWGLLYQLFGVMRLGYWFFDLSDVPFTYLDYARNLANGMVAYRDFFLEYPPLFVGVLLAAGSPARQTPWVFDFAFLMIAVTIATGSVAALSAIEVGDRRRPYVVAGVFSAMVLLLGPIAANRYDATVALALALALLFMMRGRWLAAGVTIGLGFALKISPAVLLPLVLILAPRRDAVRASAGFVVAALVPFAAAFAAGGSAGRRLASMLGYHLSRPLEVESVIALPLWLSRLAGQALSITTAAGSQVIEGAGAHAAASASTVVLLAALGGVFWLVWRRRTLIARQPRLIALAALATMLAAFVGSKVLSPQYFVWIVPLAAIVALDRHWLGATIALALLATQLLFPALYEPLVRQQAAGAALVLVVRNLLVFAAFAMSARDLWRLPKRQGRARA